MQNQNRVGDPFCVFCNSLTVAMIKRQFEQNMKHIKIIGSVSLTIFVVMYQKQINNLTLHLQVEEC